MPKMYVDGRAVEFKPGETILPAVLRAGGEIPHYCYHPGLEITAQCRQCLVEITDVGNGRGLPKLQASCATPAAEGMHVATQSEQALAGQKLVNEFILINHPLDCPICDQAGECELQDIAFRYGSGHSEMGYEKRTYGWREVGSFIALERNRCIHCSRCERFSRDLVGSHDFGSFLRSSELAFDTFDDTPMTHLFQGNLADLCPVGAITVKDWRFKKRAWKFHKTPSVCTGCSTGCNITIEHHENRVFRIKPRENPEVNRWWMCDVGRLHYRDWNARGRRHTAPQARVAGELQPASWPQVQEALLGRLRELGAKGDEVVGLADAGATLEELFTLQRLLQEGFGSEAVFYAASRDAPALNPPRKATPPFLYTLLRTDNTPNARGAAWLGLREASAGAGAPTRLLGKKCKVVVVLGAPFAEEAGLLEAAGQAELVLRLGTRPSPWDALADVILPGLNDAEKSGSCVNRQGRLQRLQPALRPPAGVRCQVRVLSDIGEGLGCGQAFSGAQAAFASLSERAGPFHKLAWEAVGPLGLAIPPPAAKQGAA